MGLDNTDGMTRLGLEYVTYRDHGVLLWIILQDVIMIINTVTTCNYFYYVTGMVWCMINKILNKPCDEVSAAAQLIKRVKACKSL